MAIDGLLRVAVAALPPPLDVADAPAVPTDLGLRPVQQCVYLCPLVVSVVVASAVLSCFLRAFPPFVAKATYYRRVCPLPLELTASRPIVDEIKKIEHFI